MESLEQVQIQKTKQMPDKFDDLCHDLQSVPQ